ncbi:hypothetical protein BG22_01650 [Bifidobacterium sp. UTBIF-78]|nr:hypothetical protein BG22_01650 [Bifidobacterium sp. UTBIF-78]
MLLSGMLVLLVLSVVMMIPFGAPPFVRLMRLIDGVGLPGPAGWAGWEVRYAGRSDGLLASQVGSLRSA